MGFLKIVVLWIDFLLWPVIALGYPVCASIRAIETGSKYHMQKLVTYWTIFALISLFEIAFVKIIEWIPLWSCIKLIAICWLLFPQFKGTVQAYQSLVQPCLSMKLQAVISSFYKQKEEKMINSFLDVAEEYIKENGLEALEQLIISKRECKKPDSSHSGIQVQGPDEQNAAATPRPWECKKPGSSHSDIQVQEPDEQNPAATPKQLKELNSAHKNIGMIEATEHTASSKPKPVQHAHSNNVGWAKKKTDAPAEVEQMIPPEAKAEARHPETPPPKKVQHEWMCTLCQVTATRKKMLNAHLRGKKHKAKIEALLTSGAAKKGVGEGSQKKPSKKNDEKVLEVKEMTPKAEDRPQEWTCALCQVTTTSEITLNAHFLGKKHKSKIEALKSSHHNEKGAGSLPSTNKTAKKNEERILSPLSREWPCTLCQVTTSSKKTLNDHLAGKKHKSKIM